MVPAFSLVGKGVSGTDLIVPTPKMFPEESLSRMAVGRPSEVDIIRSSIYKVRHKFRLSACSTSVNREIDKVSSRWRPSAKAERTAMPCA